MIKKLLCKHEYQTTFIHMKINGSEHYLRFCWKCAAAKLVRSS